VLFDKGLEDLVQLPPHAFYSVRFENLHDPLSHTKALKPECRRIDEIELHSVMHGYS
jgi:hypothetical protein